MKKAFARCALFSTFGIISFGFYQKLKSMSAITIINHPILFVLIAILSLVFLAISVLYLYNDSVKNNKDK